MLTAPTAKPQVTAPSIPHLGRSAAGRRRTSSRDALVVANMLAVSDALVVRDTLTVEEALIAGHRRRATARASACTSRASGGRVGGAVRVLLGAGDALGACDGVVLVLWDAREVRVVVALELVLGVGDTDRVRNGVVLTVLLALGVLLLFLGGRGRGLSPRGYETVRTSCAVIAWHQKSVTLCSIITVHKAIVRSYVRSFLLHCVPTSHGYLFRC